MSTEREACSRLIEQWEARARKAFPTDAMLINRHIRELHEALAQPVAAEPAYIAIVGAVFHEDSVSLIRRGYEDGYIARHPGAERVYRLAPTPA